MDCIFPSKRQKKENTGRSSRPKDHSHRKPPKIMAALYAMRTSALQS